IIKDRIKVLLWDGSGFILMYKRVERGSFKWPRNHSEAKQISVQQLEWLLRGMEIEPVKPIEKITGSRFTERNSIVQNLLKS
ncbi:IS66 family insertion sequence element accessory protein TnpB, partial [uncultured Ruminobacter sp.]|uniref:IS66 family insertion sequence element accessory protein TnpB n=1 Tax=uncultured Ruminobacter sp. TaxID=538947 RepID=UPI0025E2388B